MPHNGAPSVLTFRAGLCCQQAHPGAVCEGSRKLAAPYFPVGAGDAGAHYTCAFSKSFIEMAVGEIGIDRFMFGTALDLPRDAKAEIFGGHAQRLFAKRLAIL